MYHNAQHYTETLVKMQLQLHRPFPRVVQLADARLTLQAAQHRRRQRSVCDEAEQGDAHIQHAQRQLKGAAHHVCRHHQQL